MQFELIMLLSDIRRTCFVFALCGLFVYLYDYRPLKQKNEKTGERRFSRLVTYAYVYGSIAIYLTSIIFDAMI